MRRQDKHQLVKELQHVSTICDGLERKCDANKALLIAVGNNERPLAPRRAGQLIAEGHSPEAVLANLAKGIHMRMYTTVDYDLAALASIGIGGLRLSTAMNPRGHTPAKDTVRNRLPKPVLRIAWTSPCFRTIPQP